ncbi:MAG TPA: mersacidin/lichenicidin family type 2 lantibiotic [Thermoanaerobaculia bacterium]
MKKIDVVRAWRDEEYRNSLTPEELASLPESPAGVAVVEDSVLRSITGGCALSTKMSSCVTWPEQCP